MKVSNEVLNELERCAIAENLGKNKNNMRKQICGVQKKKYLLRVRMELI